jgi:hypothetical protein
MKWLFFRRMPGINCIWSGKVKRIKMLPDINTEFRGSILTKVVDQILVRLEVGSDNL